jgi:methylase of polypeptide subunit release factors
MRPILPKKVLENPNNIIRDVSYINDNTSTSHVHSVIKNKPDYLLIKPESHFGNSVMLLKSIRKKLYSNYYGTDKRPENPFKSCKTPNEIFNLARNIKFNIKMQLGKIGFVLLRNGEVSIVHKESSILQNNFNIQNINKEFIKKHEETVLHDDKFNRYDYFLSAEMFETIISVNNYIQKGIAVNVLGDKKIYTNYGVFNPTRQDYLELFDMFLRDNIRDIKLNTKNCIDLGCGTGVLSLLMSQYGLPRIFAIDSNENALLATRTNSQAFGYFENIKAIKLDLVEKYLNTKVSAETVINKSNQELDPHYDLIVVNPPWLDASFMFSQTGLDNAIYDPKHAFLKSAFNFAKIHLNRNNPHAKFVIIFSDLGSILNINEPNVIETLASEYKLKITHVSKKMSKLKPSDSIDPIKNFKKESKIELYELQRA